MGEPFDRRPDPDALLAEIGQRESDRGRLKIFLGMCPGVGKTYAMLLAGQQQWEDGVDTVIGVVETHGRIETQALTAGLERIPRKSIEHRGMRIEEMDLDAILARKPELVLVDELAHSNAPGSRHPKRYQDVEELLKAGIDVYTTLNVQHVESQREVVAQITGATVHETLPDSILDEADEVELIDLSPAQLRKRLQEGKVYLGERAAAASANFFREGNLMALREVALRVSAERADREVRDFLRSRKISGSLKSRDRLLVAVGPSPYSARLVRLTRRSAVAVHGSWVAVSVDTGRPLNDEARTRLEKNLALARSLGADVILTSGQSVEEAILRVAGEQNVTQIVIGKSLGLPLWDILRGGSTVDRLIRRGGDVDVRVVRVESENGGQGRRANLVATGSLWKELGIAALLVLSVTILAVLMQPALGYMAVGLLYLLSVLLGSTVLSRWPILIMAALTALAWDFLFIKPYYTFYISNLHDGILFGLFFVVALITGHLNSKVRQRERVERQRERQATTLYEFTRALVDAPDLGSALKSATRQIDSAFNVRSSVFQAEQGALGATPLAGGVLSERELAVAHYALTHNEAAGRFTNTLPESQALHLPVNGSSGVVGVFAIVFPPGVNPALHDRQMLETFASQVGLLIERDTLKVEAQQAELEEKSRSLQRTLLNSVSHEFKTPLAVITSAIESLGTEISHPLIGELRLAVARLDRIVRNQLDVTRIESGALRPCRNWCDLREVIETAAKRADTGRTPVEITVAEDVAIVRIDASLVEEILTNLIRNAIQHSTPGTAVRVVASPKADGISVEVRDEGPGLPDDPRLFEKFHRGPMAPPGGLGLGLSIARGFAEALGGRVTAASPPSGGRGAVLRLDIPAEHSKFNEIPGTS